MTAQRVIVIDLEEIRAVEIRCVECGAFMSLPIGPYPDPDLDCPSCNTQLVKGKEGKAAEAFISLFAALTAWKNAENRPFRFTFSIEAPSSEASK